MRQFGVVLLALAASLATVQAQQPVVRRTGHGTAALDVRIDRILSDPSYLILTQDTMVARTDTLAGPILTLANRVIVEGTIIGNLVIVDANVYLRPTRELWAMS
jgi:hypothetical protein